MNTVPIPKRKLLLCVRFDLSETESAVGAIDARSGGVVHDECAKAAAGASNLLDPIGVVGSCVATAGELSIEDAQALPFVASATLGCADPAVEFSWAYSSTAPVAVMRVLVSLAKCDGVTALRIGLHAMELLEGGPNDGKISSPGGFAAPPPIRPGLRHALNFANMLRRTLSSIVAASAFKLGDPLGANKLIGAKEGVIVPTTARSTIAYWAQEKPAPTSFALYAAASPKSKKANEGGETVKPYRAFLSAIENWRVKLGLRACFVLVNQRPLVVPTEVRKVTDIADDRDFRVRYAGAFGGPEAPPGDDVWPLNNFYMANVVFVNNYGRHARTFKAKATAFKWDWIGMGAHVWGGGCVEINGRFLAWVRGTREGIDACEDELAGAVGAKKEALTQARWDVIVPGGK